MKNKAKSERGVSATTIFNNSTLVANILFKQQRERPVKPTEKLPGHSLKKKKIISSICIFRGNFTKVFFTCMKQR